MVKLIHDQHPLRIAVVVQQHRLDSSKSFKLQKQRYLLPHNITIAQFIAVLRKKLPVLRPEEAIFLFLHDQTIPTTSSTMAEIFKQYKDDDGFLYIWYSKENTFG